MSEMKICDKKAAKLENAGHVICSSDLSTLDKVRLVIGDERMFTVDQNGKLFLAGADTGYTVRDSISGK